MHYRKRHYYYPKSWKALCEPKRNGNLSFKLFENIYKSLLTKLTWKVNIEKDKLWVKCLSGKYVKQNDFLSALDVKGL